MIFTIFHYFGFLIKNLTNVIFVGSASTSNFFISSPEYWRFSHRSAMNHVLLYPIVDIVEAEYCLCGTLKLLEVKEAHIKGCIILGFTSMLMHLWYILYSVAIDEWGLHRTKNGVVFLYDMDYIVCYPVICILCCVVDKSYYIFFYCDFFYGFSILHPPHSCSNILVIGIYLNIQFVT